MCEKYLIFVNPDTTEYLIQVDRSQHAAAALRRAGDMLPGGSPTSEEGDVASGNPDVAAAAAAAAASGTAAVPVGAVTGWSYVERHERCVFFSFPMLRPLSIAPIFWHSRYCTAAAAARRPSRVLHLMFYTRT